MRCNALDLSEKGDNVVRRYARRRVVRVAFRVVDRYRLAPEERREMGCHRITIDGECDPREKPDDPDVLVRQGRERMKRPTAQMGLEHIQTEGAREVHHDRGGRRDHRGSHPRDLGIACGDDDCVDSLCSPARVVVSPEYPGDLDSHFFERRGKRPPGSTGADHSNSSHPDPFLRSSPRRCRSRQAIGSVRFECTDLDYVATSQGQTLRWDEIRGQIREGREDEAPLPHSGVRNDEVGFVYNQIVDEKDVDIE